MWIDFTVDSLSYLEVSQGIIVSVTKKEWFDCQVIFLFKAVNFFGQVLRIMDTKILENYISLILLIYRPTYPIHTDPIRIALLITNKPDTKNLITL